MRVATLNAQSTRQLHGWRRSSKDLPGNLARACLINRLTSARMLSVGTRRASYEYMLESQC
jgi:hypothetical protein